MEQHNKAKMTKKNVIGEQQECEAVEDQNQVFKLQSNSSSLLLLELYKLSAMAESNTKHKIKNKCLFIF